MVYVGQLCLSWEFLQWEYEKALKLWESDQYGLRRFNEVAGEFQQFQVLLQRFIENEPFQGPRVENYARNRCAMRNLLQVPVIRGENLKKKNWFNSIFCSPLSLRLCDFGLQVPIVPLDPRYPNG